MSGIVFVHGAGDSAAIWEHQLAHLHDRDDVAAIDLPGHGDRMAEAPNDGLACRTEELLTQIDRLGFERPVVVGHGLGGALALMLALDHRDAVGGILIAGSGARLAIDPAHIERARALLDTLPSGEAAGPAFPFEHTLAPNPSAQLRGWIERTVGRATPAALVSDLEAMDGFDVLQRLETISTPTLVISGRHDRLSPPPLQHDLARLVPTAARTLVLWGAGHYVMAERAGRVNELLSEFLEELQTRTVWTAGSVPRTDRPPRPTA